ncbi:MAG: zinc-dependent alcohol dehydrogenase family protein [Actinomycetota bacterium]|nr:zinc-dependent alcohol dehydrogenase family protein [Actinomycetota bacterium]
MKAAVITAPGQIAIEEVADPTPGDNDVVVKVAAVGICGTDLHIFEGEFAPKLPIVPGHEMSGTVVAVGRSVTEIKIGDAVAIDPSLHCSECFYCRRARGNLCENWNALGVTYPGAAAQFLLSPKKNIHKLPKNVDLKSAALIEPLSCAVRGFDQLPRNPGSHYLIYGSGTMGLMMAEMAKVNGAASVSIVDLNQDKLKTAKVLGFTNLAKSADEFDQPRGFDVVIDCTGVTEAIKDGLKHVMPGGTFLQFGVANKDAKVEIEPFWVYNKEITIVGSMAVLHSFDRAVELFASGVLNTDVMISDRYSLENYADALTAFKSGKGRKTIVLPNG